MLSNSSFHQVLAQDRQRQLLRDSGVDFRTAPHRADMAARRRVEAEAERRRGVTFQPRRVSVLTALGRALRGSGVRPSSV